MTDMKRTVIFTLVMLLAAGIGTAQVLQLSSIPVSDSTEASLLEVGIGTKEIYGDICTEYKEVLDKEFGIMTECVEWEYGIVSVDRPVIGQCIKIDDSYCRVNVYQKGGINKDIMIRYDGLTGDKLDEVIDGEVAKLLESIAVIHERRKAATETLTEERVIDISGKGE